MKKHHLPGLAPPIGLSSPLFFLTWKRRLSTTYWVSHGPVEATNEDTKGRVNLFRDGHAVLGLIFDDRQSVGARGLFGVAPRMESLKF